MEISFGTYFYREVERRDFNQYEEIKNFIKDEKNVKDN